MSRSGGMTLGLLAASILILGLWLPWANRFIQQLEGDWLAPVAGGGEHQLQVRFGTQWQFDARNGVRLLGQYGEVDDFDRSSVELRWQHYF